MKLSHKELVKIATKWAYGRHQVVIAEKPGVYENPDVMAFSYQYSTLIECKTNFRNSWGKTTHYLHVEMEKKKFVFL